MLSAGEAFARSVPTPGDPALRELMQVAIDVAKQGGASYSDVRISARRQQNVATRDRIVIGVGDTDSFGLACALSWTERGDLRRRAHSRAIPYRS